MSLEKQARELRKKFPHVVSSYVYKCGQQQIIAVRYGPPKGPGNRDGASFETTIHSVMGSGEVIDITYPHGGVELEL